MQSDFVTGGVLCQLINLPITRSTIFFFFLSFLFSSSSTDCQPWRPSAIGHRLGYVSLRLFIYRSPPFVEAFVTWALIFFLGNYFCVMLVDFLFYYLNFAFFLYYLVKTFLFDNCCTRVCTFWLLLHFVEQYSVTYSLFDHIGYCINWKWKHDLMNIIEMRNKYVE